MSDLRVSNKRIIPIFANITTALQPYAELVLRVTVGALLIPHGYEKLFTPGALEGTGTFFETVGLTPGYELALAVALVEFVGGIMLVLGLLTRPVAIAVAVFMSQAVAFHFDNGFKWTDGGYEFPLMWMVAALFFAVRGGGYLSVDQKIGKEF